MKGICYDGTRAVYREDLPVPQAAPGYTRIRVLLADICSTDKEILKGYRPDFHGVMGHEFVGVVDEVGGAREEGSDAAVFLDADGQDLRHEVGRMVVGELNEGCGHCLYCRTGREKHCMERRVIGMSRDGCFAEYMTLANHLIHTVPDGLEPEKAVFTEPLAAALEIPSQVHLDPAGNAAVIGDGRLAFMIAQVLSLTGTALTAIGKHPEKLDKFRPFARTRTIDSFGLDLETEAYASAGAHYEPAPERIGEDTFEVVVDATGAPSGLDLAARIVRRRGTIVMKSTYAGTAQVDMSHIVVNEISIVGSRCGPFVPALNLLARGMVRFPAVEWHALSDFEAAFASHAFKAGFRIG